MSTLLTSSEKITVLSRSVLPMLGLPDISDVSDQYFDLTPRVEPGSTAT